MIKPQDKLFANLIAQLRRDLPREPLTRVVNLAALALGILRSKRLSGNFLQFMLPLFGSEIQGGAPGSTDGALTRCD